jgi:eight-cysteine-cluster-containing protein
MKKLSYIHIMVGAGVVLVSAAIVAYAVTNQVASVLDQQAPIQATDETMENNNGTFGGCVPAGCSGTICAEATEAADIVTTCEYRDEYACYKLTTCERQLDGKCGWTPAAGFASCLNDPPILQ